MNSLHQLSQITPQIYITSWWTAKDFKILKNAGITHVLSLCQNGDKVEQAHRDFVKLDHPLNEPEMIYKSITNWIDIPEPEEVETFKNIIPECNDFIHDCLKSDYTKILIHCQSGRSRSVSIATVYFMTAFDSIQRTQSKKDKVELIRQGKRLVATPNYRKCQILFRKCLKNLKIVFSELLCCWGDPKEKMGSFSKIRPYSRRNLQKHHSTRK